MTSALFFYKIESNKNSSKVIQNVDCVFFLCHLQTMTTRNLTNETAINEIEAWAKGWGGERGVMSGFEFDPASRKISYVTIENSPDVFNSTANPLVYYYIPSELLLDVTELGFAVDINCTDPLNNLMDVGYYQNKTAFVLLKGCARELIISANNKIITYDIKVAHGNPVSDARFQIDDTGSVILWLNGHSNKLPVQLDLASTFAVIECNLEILNKNNRKSSLTFLNTIKLLSGKAPRLKPRASTTPWVINVLAALVIGVGVVGMASETLPNQNLQQLTVTDDLNVTHSNLSILNTTSYLPQSYLNDPSFIQPNLDATQVAIAATEAAAAAEAAAAHAPKRKFKKCLRR